MHPPETLCDRTQAVCTMQRICSLPLCSLRTTATWVGKPTQGIDSEIGVVALAGGWLIRRMNEKRKHKAQLVLFFRWCVLFFFLTVISSGGDRCFLKWQEICKAECYSTYRNCFINIACAYGFYLSACGTSYFK